MIKMFIVVNLLFCCFVGTVSAGTPAFNGARSSSTRTDEKNAGTYRDDRTHSRVGEMSDTGS